MDESRLRSISGFFGAQPVEVPDGLDIAELVAEFDRLTADLAAATAREAALRSACFEEVPEHAAHLSMSGYTCRLCGWDTSPDFPEEHNPTCVLYDSSDAGNRGG